MSSITSLPLSRNFLWIVPKNLSINLSQLNIGTYLYKFLFYTELFSKYLLASYNANSFVRGIPKEIKVIVVVRRWRRFKWILRRQDGFSIILSDSLKTLRRSTLLEEFSQELRDGFHFWEWSPSNDYQVGICISVSISQLFLSADFYSHFEQKHRSNIFSLSEAGMKDRGT